MGGPPGYLVTDNLSSTRPRAAPTDAHCHTFPTDAIVYYLRRNMYDQIHNAICHMSQTGTQHHKDVRDDKCKRVRPPTGHQSCTEAILASSQPQLGAGRAELVLTPCDITKIESSLTPKVPTRYGKLLPPWTPSLAGLQGPGPPVELGYR